MKKRFLKLISTFLVLFVIGILGAILIDKWDNLNVNNLFKGNEPSEFEEKEEKEKSELSEPDQVTLSLMFFGDIFFGRYIDDWSQASDLKYAYPFSGLDTFGRENYDAWIGNLECPVTTTYRSSAQQNANLMFSCQSEYLPEARKWFDIFSLANNHTDNMEHVDGFQQTKNFLEENNFQYFGHYDDSVSDEVCEVVSIKTSPLAPLLDNERGTLEEENNGEDSPSLERRGLGGGQDWFDDEADYEKYIDLLSKTDEEISEDYEGELRREFYVPIALCGFHGVFNLPTDEDLAVIEEYSKFLPTFIMPHQGQEYKFTANSYQENIYRKMVDLGADAVIGGHTHTVQNTEVYKNKLIVYSLGNFIFDQTTKYKTEGLALGLDMTFKYDENFEEWLNISKECIVNEDSCLSKATELGLVRPQFQIQYEAVGTDNSNKLAKKALAAVEATILERANWEETVNQLDSGAVEQ